MTKKKTIDYNFATAVTKYLLAHNEFLILTHRNPDGDTMGSAAALCSALRRSGKTAYLYPNKQATEKIRRYTESFFAGEKYAVSCVISVDVASQDMLAEGFLGMVDCCIDHHPTNSGFGTVNLICPEKSACGEIVLTIIENMHRGLTKEEANLLYIAISTDIIVGFPGETEEDFEETLSLCEYCKYDNAFTFIYSPRENTPASKMKDNISLELNDRDFLVQLKLTVLILLYLTPVELLSSSGII